MALIVGDGAFNWYAAVSKGIVDELPIETIAYNAMIGIAGDIGAVTDFISASILNPIPLIARLALVIGTAVGLHYARKKLNERYDEKVLHFKYEKSP